MTAVCSWCSAELTEGATECPSCGANLVPDGEPNVPGVTAVDAASIIRSKSAPQPRSRLLSWISGDYATDIPSKSEQQAIAPPDLDVRREIFRLELEAEVANLQAQADAFRAEAAAEGRVLDFPEDLAIPGIDAAVTADGEPTADDGAAGDQPPTEAATDETARDATKPEEPAAAKPEEPAAAKPEEPAAT